MLRWKFQPTWAPPAKPLDVTSEELGEIDTRWVGFDIANEFVVGYGLDYAEQYRNLREIGTLAPHVYS